ncbi:AMP-binding protein [Rhizobium sp. CSW-27]|uniref:class I adenylate-forming enzyme family protein n=1 Tax=Rhizobium sp. CSW-27 TaxID=2839985 RepID=UPI00207886BF|nr:AMP-binding protein [Rhizobium sp. CSW-27]
MSQIARIARTVAAHEHHTIADIFARSLESAGNRRFAKSSDADLTYEEAAFAAGAIASRLGKAVAERPVVILMPNSVSLLVTYLAVLSLRGEPVLLNPLLPPATRHHLIAKLSPAAVVTAQAMGDQDATLLVADRDLAGLAQEGRRLCLDAHPDDVAVNLYSGGTTGVPKRVVHTHRGMVAAVERMEWGWPSRDGDVWLPIAPFTHVYGFLMGVTNPMLRAGSIIIPDRFHPATIIDLMREHAVTVFGGGPPAIYQGLLSVPGIGPESLPSLRVCPGGGAPFPTELHRRWQDVTGLAIHEGYGMTEIAPIAVNTQSEGLRIGAAGKPCPGTEVEIVDTVGGTRRLGCGEPGEIRVRGPHQMTGYADNAEETALMVRDGWVYTGDIGVIDEDGFLTITDRKKNVIFHKGFNVFPREIEEVLVSHPAVAAASVVGIPDARCGEIAVAFVVARDGVEAEALTAFCAETLVPYKLPSRIVFLKQLPLTPAGKPDRMAMQAFASQSS